MSEFYNANKLLSLKDRKGKPPELFFCCGNRTAGKTFYFKRWMLRRFARHGEKFVIFVRFIDDLPNVVDGFFADIGPIAFQRHEMSQKPLIHGKAAELYFDRRPCGYVIALNDPERIKRNSALFSDAERGFLDEFMSETGKYVPQELVKFNSIRLSIARGGARGKHARYFPVYLCSNNVTLFNPYFEYFGISAQMSNRLKYLRGDGWVLEQTFNQHAAAAIRENFSTVSEEELAYATRNEYLLDNNAFVDHLPGMKACIAIMRYGRKTFGIWSDFGSSKVYISKHIDPSCQNTLAFVDADHGETTQLIARGHPVFKWLKQMYEKGLVWFESGAARHAFITSLCIQ